VAGARGGSAKSELAAMNAVSAIKVDREFVIQ
jgi:hypothetical protein